jgi:hypothetical protein
MCAHGNLVGKFGWQVSRDYCDPCTPNAIAVETAQRGI